MIYDFIIIGAGISGLYTYYLIKQTNPNIKILILESSNRIGGRILKDDNIDLGFRMMINDSYIDIDTIYMYTYSVYIYIYIVIYSKIKMDVNQKGIPPVL